MPHQLLLADNSVTIQRVIRLTFADEDVTVIAVGDGNRAIAAIDESPPDIVLADIGLPGRDGYEVARHLRGTPGLAHIPVVLLRGAFDAVDEPRAAAAGCDRVLSKPFDPQVVVMCVRELLAGPRTLAAPAASHRAGHEVEAEPAPAADPADYFERLDLTFSHLADPPAITAVGEPETFAIDVEGLEPPFAPTEPSGGALPSSDPLSGVPDPGVFPGTAGHDAPVSAWEDGADAPTGAKIFPVVESAAAPLVISDELIDEIATRVIDRLMVRLSSGAVSDVVTAVAERLVRAEIDTIRGRLQELPPE